MTEDELLEIERFARLLISVRSDEEGDFEKEEIKYHQAVLKLADEVRRLRELENRVVRAWDQTKVTMANSGHDDA